MEIAVILYVPVEFSEVIKLELLFDILQHFDNGDAVGPQTNC